MGVRNDHPWVAGLTVLAVCLLLFAVYYLRRARRHAGVKEYAGEVFSDLADRLGGESAGLDQSHGSLYQYPDLGRVTGRTRTLTYEVGCYPRGFEDVGGSLYCTVSCVDEVGVFDLPVNSAIWSSRTSRHQDSVTALFGRRYAEQARPDLGLTLAALAGMSLDLTLHPAHVRAHAPPQVFDWPDRQDTEAAAAWVNDLLTLVATLPTRPA